MKKIVLVLFALCFCLGANVQAADLYDVNFDAPRNIPSYNEDTQIFQDIFLQYEDAIRRSEENIRSEERNLRQDDVQKFNENLNKEQEKALQEQKKHQEELTQIQIKFEQELAQEQKKALEDLAQALEKQKQEIYAKEIEQLRKDEYEKLTTELHDSITKELTENFTVEYENKVKQLTAEYDAEYEAKIAEIEIQKESEMKVWKKENKKQALEETNAITERMRILAPYIVAIIAVAVIILLGWLLGKAIIKIKNEKKENKKEQEEINKKIDGYKLEYLNRLQRVGGSNIYRNEIQNIYDEINAQQGSDDDKILRKEAIKQAEKEFDLMRITLSIDEYRKKFDDLNPKRFFNTWNTLGDDIEAKKATISDFLVNVAEYEKYAISASKSENDQTAIANLLKPYSPILRNNSTQLTVMKDSESDETLKGQLTDLSSKYQELADKFNKGIF